MKSVFYFFLFIVVVSSHGSSDLDDIAGEVPEDFDFEERNQAAPDSEDGENEGVRELDFNDKSVFLQEEPPFVDPDTEDLDSQNLEHDPRSEDLQRFLEPSPEPVEEGLKFGLGHSSDTLKNPPVTLPHAVEKFKRYVVEVAFQSKKSESGSGTGFFINNTTVVTNWHVISNYNPTEANDHIYIDLANNKQLRVRKVIAASARLDLALIQTEPLEPQFFSHNITQTAHQGEKLYTLGWPGNRFEAIAGHVSSINLVSYEEPASIVLVTNFANEVSGASGAPLLNEKGQLVGVVRQFYEDHMLQRIRGAAISDVNQLWETKDLLWHVREALEGNLISLNDLLQKARNPEVWGWLLRAIEDPATVKLVLDLNPSISLEMLEEARLKLGVMRMEISSRYLDRNKEQEREEMGDGIITDLDTSLIFQWIESELSISDSPIPERLFNEVFQNNNQVLQDWLFPRMLNFGFRMLKYLQKAVQEQNPVALSWIQKSTELGDRIHILNELEQNGVLDELVQKPINEKSFEAEPITAGGVGVTELLYRYYEVNPQRALYWLGRASQPWRYTRSQYIGKAS